MRKLLKKFVLSVIFEGEMVSYMVKGNSQFIVLTEPSGMRTCNPHPSRLWRATFPQGKARV